MITTTMLPPVYCMESDDDGSTTKPRIIGFLPGKADKYQEFARQEEEHDVMWEFLLFLKENYPGLTVYANDSSDSDHKFIVNTLVRHEQTLDFPGGTTKIRWVEADITFMDSYNIMSMGLNKATRAMGVIRDLNGSNGHNPRVHSNCLALAKALSNYEALMQRHFPGISPLQSSTLSLTSVKIFDKKFFPLKQIHSNEEHEHYVRQATFAGRNEIFRRYGENVKLYDIRGNYVSCYDFPVPIGKLQWITPNIREGTLAEAQVTVPDHMFIGPLPIRYGKRLIFPVGKLQGWWDMVELRFAAELGCEVELLRQLKADEEPIMQDFGEKVCTLRDEAEYEHFNPDLGRIFKNLGLRLVGKLGQHRTRTEIISTISIDNLCGWSPIDEGELYHERTTRMNGSRMPYVKPAINMRIRAEARKRHLEYLLEAEKYGELHYCDTDSVYTTADMPVGKEHGCLQLKDVAPRAYFIKNKVYGYTDRMGKVRQRTAGFRDYAMSEAELQALVNGDEVSCSWEGLPGWKEVLSLDDLEVVTRHRTIKDDGVYNRVILKDKINTRPVKVEMFQ